MNRALTFLFLFAVLIGCTTDDQQKPTEEQAKDFYKVHKDRSFYNDLVNYMISGPIIVQILSGNDAIEKYRKIMGATNPEIADEGTIRNNFALSIQENSVHGSDSIENASKEINFFFSDEEIIDK